MAILKISAVILKEIDTGESNKQLIVLCPQYGRLLLSAKGARQPKSKLLAATQLFSHVDFILFQGSGYYSITQAQLLDSFYSIRQDLNKLAYACYAADLAERTAMENLESGTAFAFLVDALTVLAKTKIMPRLWCYIFELKYLQILGFLPEQPQNEVPLSIGAKKAVAYIVNQSGKQVFSFRVDEAVLSQLGALGAFSVLNYIGISFPTRAFAEEL